MLIFEGAIYQVVFRGVGRQRPLAAYLLQKHGGLTQREIAGILGLKMGAAVSVQLRRFQVELLRQRACSQALVRIERQLAG